MNEPRRLHLHGRLGFPIASPAAPVAVPKGRRSASYSSNRHLVIVVPLLSYICGRNARRPNLWLVVKLDHYQTSSAGSIYRTSDGGRPGPNGVDWRVPACCWHYGISPYGKAQVGYHLGPGS